MKVIQVLGSGCRNCRVTAELIQEVARSEGVEVRIEKVEEMADIMVFGVLSTPGVVVDGRVVHSGGIPERAEVAGWL